MAHLYVCSRPSGHFMALIFSLRERESKQRNTWFDFILSRITLAVSRIDCSGQG